MQEKQPLNWQQGVIEGSLIRFEHREQRRADGKRHQFSHLGTSKIQLFIWSFFLASSSAVSFLNANCSFLDWEYRSSWSANGLFKSWSTLEVVGRAKWGFRLKDVISSYVYCKAPAFFTRHCIVVFISCLNFSGFSNVFLHRLSAGMPDLPASS